MKWISDDALARLQSLANTPTDTSSAESISAPGLVTLFEPGDRIGDRFEVVSMIGAGGMGSVVRARDLVRGGEVAVKISSVRGGALDQRFAREAAALAELRHPHVVTYIEHGTTSDDELYLAMELLHGEPLSAALRRGRLSVDNTLLLAHGVSSALAAAHARGIVHRDVKPSNVFLQGRSFAHVKLLDFGLVRHLIEEAELTKTGSFLGTPGYMAPEQARGEKYIDSRADVFGLGCVLYESLSGLPPFKKDTISDTLASILLEQLPDVRVHRPDVPPPFAELIERMLQKAPAARPADGAEVQEVIDRVIAVRPSVHGDDLPTLKRGEADTSFTSAPTQTAVIEPGMEDFPPFDADAETLKRGKPDMSLTSGSAGPATIDAATVARSPAYDADAQTLVAPRPTPPAPRLDGSAPGAPGLTPESAAARGVVVGVALGIALLIGAAAFRASASRNRVAVAAPGLAAIVHDRARVDVEPPASPAPEPAASPAEASPSASAVLEPAEATAAHGRPAASRPWTPRPATSTAPSRAKGSVPLPNDPG